MKKNKLSNNSWNLNYNFIDKDDISKEAITLRNIVKKLRSPDGCPWDRKLEIEDCTEYILEETHEAIEAIDKNDTDSLLEELGDILSQIFMISQIADEKKLFNISDVFNNISNKLVFRHPHVFGNEKAENADKVLEIWNKQKLKEKKERKNIIEGIPKSLPSIYILIKLFRKLRQYPEIFEFIRQKILISLNDIMTNSDKHLANISNTIEKDILDNDVKEENDLTKNFDKEEDIFLGELLLTIVFYSYLKGIDCEKYLRKKIDEIYTIFEDNDKGTDNN